MFLAFHLIVALIGCLLVALTLPLLLELLILSLAAMLPGKSANERRATLLRLAVIIPAHDEEKLIGKCIASVANAADVFVVAHNCTDATAEVASQAGAKVLELNDSVGGKGTALEYGFRYAIEAGADILLVIDADTVAGPNLVPEILAAFGTGAQAVQCRYEVANPNTNRRTRLASLALRGMNVLRPLGRHHLGLSCGIFGNGFALSASTLARVPYTPNSLVEDLEYHLHLVRAGMRVEFLNHTSVFGEMPESSAAATSQRARWEGGRILMRRLWQKPLALGVLRGNLRLLEPLLDLLAVPLATEAAFLILVLTIGLAAHLYLLAAYGFVGSLTLALYVVIAAFLGSEPLQTLQALASAPAFLVWKVMMIPRTRRAARSNTEWVRTARNAEVGKPERPTD